MGVIVITYVAVAVAAQALDVITWALMPRDLVREANPIVLAMGPTLAVNAKVIAVFVAATLIADFWWWRPGIARLISGAYVLAGSVGALSNLPR